MSRAFYRSYVHAGRRAGQVRRLHILREDGPWAGKQGECGIHAWAVTRSQAVGIDPMPATPPEGLEWCGLCVARHNDRESEWTDSDERRMDVQEAATHLGCPYIRSGGKCVTGCWSEPRCITDAPEGGWEGVLVQAEREEPGSVRAALEAMERAR